MVLFDFNRINEGKVYERETLLDDGDRAILIPNRAMVGKQQQRLFEKAKIEEFEK